MGTAKFMRNIEGWKGDARLYNVSPPATYEPLDSTEELKTEYVIVSAVDAMFTGPETYIFPGTAEGEAIAMIEMGGSFQGALDHEAALRGAGYAVVEGE